MSLPPQDGRHGPAQVRLTTKADEVFPKAFSLFNTDEENEDENFTGEAFEATSVSLWKADVEDKSCKSLAEN